MSRVSYYQAKRPKIGKTPVKEKPAQSVQGDLSAPLSFVQAAEQAVQASSEAAASLDRVYRDVLSGPAVSMNSTHFRKASPDEKTSHGFPPEVPGDWWILVDPRLGIPINNRCKMALQSYLVSEVVLLLAPVRVLEARSSTPEATSLNSTEEDAVMDGMQPPPSSAFTVKDVRVIIAEYVVSRDLTKHEELLRGGET